MKIESSSSGCPFSQNALQLLYHSERIDAPLKRTGKKGTVKPSAFEKVSWEEALTAVSKKMNSLIAAKKGGLSTWEETRDAIHKIYPKLFIIGENLSCHSRENEFALS